MTANLRISGAQTKPRSESDIRVNYNDMLKIIAASNNIGDSNQAQFYSSDGGATWGQTTLPLTTGDIFHSDPNVDWTSDGTAWAITLGIDATQTNLKVRCYKSTDGGKTWNFDSTASGNHTATDKEIMWIDHSPTSTFKDNIYVIYHNNDPAFVVRRAGSGGTWQTPVQVSGTETTGTAIGGDIKTNSFGDVFAFWPDTGTSKMFVSKSTDGGATFSTPIRIATTFDSYDIGIPSFATRRALIYISGGAYRTATKNLVYSIWTDQTGTAGCNSPSNEPGTNVSSTCKTRIWFSRSIDGGTTWEAPKMINNPTSLNDQFNPRLVVDETNGQLVVIYYDTVGDSARLKTDVWMQISSDDGVTWSTAVKITTSQTDETASSADSGNQYGDYNGISGYKGTFFPSWTDRRNGGSEEIWTTLITSNVTLKFRDDVGTLKFRDDGGTVKFIDDGGTLKFADDVGTLKFRDDVTLKFRDDVTLKFRDDVGTLKFRDDGGGTLKFADDGGTLKFADDVVAKSPISDVTQGGIPPESLSSATPFILATPHHSMAWTRGYTVPTSNTEYYENILSQYEVILGYLEEAIKQKYVELKALEDQYSTLIEEHNNISKEHAQVKNQ